MTEIWEKTFIEKQMMWGSEPTESAILVKNFFLENNFKEILIPGIGYGRNARPFLENGFNVTGIEISGTAVKMAESQIGSDIKIYHGSVTDMPFDNKVYDGIFCFALIHLLGKQEREKLLRDCYNQLKTGGYMIFTTISKKAPMYGKGKQVEKDRFENAGGVQVFFYDSETISQEFEKYGLVEFSEVNEPFKHTESESSLPFLLIKCKK